MTKFRIQYVSNLFLNKYPHTVSSILKPCAPYLALCGNIGVANCPTTRDFLKMSETMYEKIFWIPGTLEYSPSSATTPTSWREQSDKCYQSIKNWDLKKTTFCQKFELNLTNSYSILATPLWHTNASFSEYKLYDYKNNIYMQMNNNDFQKLYLDEYYWILSRIKNNSSKKILLSYSNVHGLKEGSPVIWNLFGKEETNIPKSYSGGYSPWIGINMLGCKGFKKDAFVEIDTNKF